MTSGQSIAPAPAALPAPPTDWLHSDERLNRLADQVIAMGMPVVVLGLAAGDPASATALQARLAVGAAAALHMLGWRSHACV